MTHEEKSHLISAVAIPTDMNAYQMAIASHTVSITNATEMRLHREECKGRDERTEKKFDEIFDTMKDMDRKMDRQTTTLSEKIDNKYEELTLENKQANKTLYMIVGGLILASSLFSKIPLHFFGG